MLTGGCASEITYVSYSKENKNRGGYVDGFPQRVTRNILTNSGTDPKFNTVKVVRYVYPLIYERTRENQEKAFAITYLRAAELALENKQSRIRFLDSEKVGSWIYTSDGPAMLNFTGTISADGTIMGSGTSSRLAGGKRNLDWMIDFYGFNEMIYVEFGQESVCKLEVCRSAGVPFGTEESACDQSEWCRSTFSEITEALKLKLSESSGVTTPFAASMEIVGVWYSAVAVVKKYRDLLNLK
jgi:hypothetical protein